MGKLAELVELARRPPWAVVTLVVLAIVLAVLPFALIPESVPDEHTALASVSSVVLLVFALFTLVRDTFSAWQLVVALAVLVALVGTGLFIWRVVDQSRALTVTDSVELSAGAESMKNGKRLTLSLRAPAPRDQLLLTFDAKDHGFGSPCVPSSHLSLSQHGRGTKRTQFGEEISIDLAGDRSVRLEIALQTDTGCVLEVEVAKAVLRNNS